VGTGEAIALNDATIDLVFMSMVFHHFSDSSKVARECRRILRPRGGVFVRTGTVEQIPAYPYVTFIPASRPLLEERLPQKNFIVEVFEGAGFRTTSVDVVVQEIAPTYAAYAEKLAAGGDSILASLPPGDVECGLEAIRTHAAKGDPQPVFEPIDLLVFQ
jgi:ubiquinone/menaquinone biosynthesis C-methylase UbiE